MAAAVVPHNPLEVMSAIGTGDALLARKWAAPGFEVRWPLIYCVSAPGVEIEALASEPGTLTSRSANSFLKG